STAVHFRENAVHFHEHAHGKQTVALQGTAIVVNGAMVNRNTPELFPVTIWLAFGLLGAKWKSAAPSAGGAQASITH
ncbi:MAG: hypothetical protein WBS14_00330, partial [Rhodomicrobium sp.]